MLLETVEALELVDSQSNNANNNTAGDGDGDGDAATTRLWESKEAENVAATVPAWRHALLRVATQLTVAKATEASLNHCVES